MTYAVLRDFMAAIEQAGTDDNARVVILTGSNEQAMVGRATAAGAAGFLSKNGPLGDVLNAVHTAYRGGMTVSTDILARLLRSTG